MPLRQRKVQRVSMVIRPSCTGCVTRLGKARRGKGGLSSLCHPTPCASRRLGNPQQMQTYPSA